jgi:hypothetical protein
MLLFLVKIFSNISLLGDSAPVLPYCWTARYRPSSSIAKSSTYFIKGYLVPAIYRQTDSLISKCGSLAG